MQLFSARFRALGPGGKSPPQAPKSPPQAPLSEIRRAERPSPLTKWPQIRLHARHGRDIEDPEVAVLRRFDGVTGRSPGAKNARLLPLPAIRLPVESCGQTSGGGSRIGPLGRGETRASIPLGAAARPAVPHTSLRAPNPPAQARTHHRGTRGPTEAHRARSRAARPPPYHPEAPCHLPYRPCRPQVPNGPRWNSPALSIAIPVLCLSPFHQLLLPESTPTVRSP